MALSPTTETLLSNNLSVDYLTSRLLKRIPLFRNYRFHRPLDDECSAHLKEIYLHMRKLDVPERVRCSRIHEIVSFAYLKSLHATVGKYQEIMSVFLGLLQPQYVDANQLYWFIYRTEVEVFRPIVVRNAGNGRGRRVVVSSRAGNINSRKEILHDEGAGGVLELLHTVYSATAPANARIMYSVRSHLDIFNTNHKLFTYEEMIARQKAIYPNQKGLIYIPEVYMVGSQCCSPGRAGEICSWEDVEDRSMYDLLVVLTYFRELGNAIYRWAFPSSINKCSTYDFYGNKISTTVMTATKPEEWTYAIEKKLFLGNVIYGLGNLIVASSSRTSIKADTNYKKRNDYACQMKAVENGELGTRENTIHFSREDISSKASLKPAPGSCAPFFNQSSYLVHVGPTNDPISFRPVFQSQNSLPTSPSSPSSSSSSSLLNHQPIKAYKLMEFFKTSFYEILFPPRRFLSVGGSGLYSWQSDFTFIHGDEGRVRDCGCELGCDAAWETEACKKGTRRSRWWERKTVGLQESFRGSWLRFA